MVDALDTRMDSYDYLYSKRSLTGKLLYYCSTFGDDILIGVADTLADETAREKLMDRLSESAADISSVLCDRDELRELILVSEEVPVEEIQDFACDLDPEQVLEELKDANEGNEKFQLALDYLSGQPSDTFDKGFDWVALVEESSDLYTRMISNDVQKNVTFDWDWDRLGTAMSDLMGTSSNMTLYETLTQMEPMMTGGLEEAMAAYDLPQFDRIKHTMHYVNELVNMLNDDLDDTDGISLKSLMKTSATLNSTMQSLSNSAPDLLEAFTEAMVEPSKVMKLMLTTDLADKSFCDDLSLSEVMTFPKEVNLEDLEQELCDMDLGVVVEELKDDPWIKKYTDVFEKIQEFDDTQEPFPLNMTEMFSNMESLVANLQEMMSDGDVIDTEIPGLNMTAVEDKARNMLERMGDLDTESVSDIILYTIMGPVSGTLEAYISTPDLWTEMEKYILASDAFYVFASTYLQDLRDKGELTLFDHLNYTEVRDLLSRTPESATYILNSLVDILADPMKVSELASEDVGALCDDLELFEKFFPEPEDRKYSAAEMQDTLCGASSLNLTSIMDELIDGVRGLRVYQEQLSDIFEDNDESDLSLNLTAMIEHYRTYSELFTELVENPPTLDLGLDPEWRDADQWLDTWERHLDDIMDSDMASLLKILQNPSNYEEMDDILTELWDMLLEQPGLSDMNGYLVLYNTYLEYALTLLKTFNESSELDLMSYVESEELDKLMTGLETSPEALELVLGAFTSHLLNPMELSTFLDDLNNPDLCDNMTKFNSVFPLASDSTVNRSTVHDAFCDVVEGVNFTAILPQLIDSLDGLEEYRDKLTMDPADITEKANLSAIIVNHLTFVDLLNDLTLTPPELTWGSYDWLDLDLWSGILEGQSDIGDELSGELGGVLGGNSYVGTVELLDSLLDLEEFYGIFHVWTALADIMQEKLDDLHNVSVIHMADLFPESPEMQKLSDLVENTPEVLEILMYSYGTPKFHTLLDSNLTMALLMLCHDDSDLEDYLTLPSGSEVDLDDLQAEFCNISLDDLEEEFLEEFDSLDFAELMSDRSPVNWTALFLQSTELYDTLTTLIEQSPGVSTEGSWMDGDRWVELLGEYMESNNMAAQSFYSYAFAMNEMASIMEGNPDIDRLNEVLQDIVNSINDQILSLPDGELTFYDLFKDTPELLELVTSSVDLWPDVMEMLLHAPISNPSFLVEAMLSGDPFEFLCEKDIQDLNKMFDLPDDTNLDDLHGAICDLNRTEMSSEFFRLLGLERLVTESNDGGAFNWTAFLLTSADLNTNIQSFMENLTQFTMPEFDADQVSGILDEFVDKMDLTDVDNLWALLDSALTSLYGNEAMDVSDDYYRALLVTLDYVNDIFDKVDLSQQRLDLADLFRNSSDVRDVLEVVFDLGSDVVTGLMEATVTPEKILELAGMSNAEIKDIFCDADRLEEYVDLPATLNVSSAVEKLCGVDVNDLLDELQAEFDFSGFIDALTTTSEDQVNITDFIDSYERFYQNILDLAEVTEVTMLGQQLETNFDLSTFEELPALLTLLQDEGRDMQDADVENYATLLEKLSSSLEGTDFWKTFRDNMVAGQVYADILNDKITELPDSTITLSDLLLGANYTTSLLEQLYQDLPNITTALMTAHVDLAKLLSSPDLLSSWCSDAVTYPDSTDSTAIQETVCDANFTDVWTELSQQLDWSVIQERLLAGAGDIENTPLNWTSLVQSMITLQENLGEFIGDLSSESLPQFAVFDGDYTDWLERMDTALKAPAFTDDDTVNWLADMLQKQMSDPALADLWASVLPSLNAVNTLADALLLKLDDLPVNFTLADLLVGTSRSNELVNTVFNVTPELLDAMLNTPVDLIELITAAESLDVQDFLCNSTTAQSNPSLESAVEYLCDTNITEVIGDQVNFVDWDNIISQFAKVDTDIDPETFNWTTYLSNLESLQSRFNIFLEGQEDLTLTQFLVPGRDVESLLEKLRDSITEPSSTADWLDGVKISLDVMLEFMQTSSLWWKSLQPINTVIQAVNDRLTDILNSGSVSLDTLLVDAPELTDLLETTLGMDNETMEALLNAGVDPDFVQSLLEGSDVRSKLCDEDDMSGWLSLPPDVSNVTLEELRGTLCAVDTEAVLDEIRNQLDLRKVIQEFGKLSDLPDYDHGNVSDYVGTIETLTDLVSQLMSTPPSVDSSLQDLLDFTSLGSLLKQTFISQPMEKMVYPPMKDFLQQIYQDDRQRYMRYLIDAMVEVAVDQLQDLQDDDVTLSRLLSNATTLTQLLKDIGSKYTKLFRDDIADELGVTPQLKHLAKYYPELREMVCNATALQAIADAPLYINITAMSATVCPLPVTDWFSSLRKAGFVSEEIASLVTKLDEWSSTHSTDYMFAGKYLDEWSSTHSTDYMFAGKYDFTALPNVTWSHIDPELEQLLDLMVTFIDLQDVDLDLEILLKALSGLNKGFDSSMFDDVEELLLQLDPMLSGGRADMELWDKLKEYTYASALTLRYLNDQMDDIIADGEMVQLSSLFKDMDIVEKLVTEATSPETANQLLDAVLQHKQVADLSTMDGLREILCDQKLFNNTFELPDGELDATTVQKQLCDAASNDTDFLQKLLDEMDFNQYYKELQKLFEEGTGSIAENPWSLFIDQLETFLSNAELIQDKAGLNTTELFDWLAPFNPGNYWDDALSDLLCQAIFDQPGSKWLTRNLGIPDYMEMAFKGMLMMPDVEDLVCSLPDMNITNLRDKLENSTILTKMEELLNLATASSSPDRGTFCDRVTSAQAVLQEVIEDWDTVFDAYLGFVDCLGEAQGQSIHLFDDIDSMLTLLSDAEDILSDIPDLEALDALMPYMNIIIDALLVEKPVLLVFEELLTNVSQARDFLTEVLKLSPNVTETILKTYVNLDLMHLYNASDSELEAFLCDPDQLTEMFSFMKPLGLDTDTLLDTVCGPELNVTIQQIRNGLDMGRVLVELLQSEPSYTVDTDWLELITDDLQQVLTSVDDLLELVSMGDTLDTDDLLDVLPSIQEFVMDRGPEKAFENIEKLISDLRLVLDDPTSEDILDDLQMLADGVAGLHILRKYLGLNVRLSELVESPADLYKYMVDDLHLSPEVAQAILDASISYAKLVDARESVNVKELVCDGEELGELLQLSNDSAVDAAVISAELCALDQDTAVDVMQYLLDELDIGDLIKQFIQLSPDNFLDSANMTTPEVQDMLKNFGPLRDSLDDMIWAMTNLSTEVDLPALAEALEGEGKGPTVLESLGQFFCGRSGAFAFEDEFNLNTDRDHNDIDIDGESDSDSQTPSDSAGPSKGVGSSTGSGNRTQPGTGLSPKYNKYPSYVKKTISMFKTDFCRDLYLDLVKDPGGKIVWTFMKPLLLGRIPFAPDTPTTRAIMQEVQSSLNQIQDMQDFADMWQDSSEDLEDFTNITDTVEVIKDAIQNPFVAGAMSSLLGTDSATFVDDLDSLSSLSAKKIRQFDTLASFLSKMIDCVELDRLEAFSTEDEVEDRAKTLSYSNSVMAAVVFLDVDDDVETRARRAVNNSTPHSSLPKHIKYKLRMDVDNTPLTVAARSRTWEAYDDDSFPNNMRYMRGFIILQDMIERAIIRLQTGGQVATPNVETVQFPFPCYEKDDFQMYVSSYFFPILMTLSWMVVIATAIRNLVYDRERRLDDTMRAMGMRAGVGWVAWFVNTYLGMLVLCVVVTLFMKLGRLMRYSDPILIFVYLADYSLATTMMCYLISVFFNRTTLAALTGMIVYLTSNLPFVVLISMRTEMLFWQTVVACLSATVPFGHGAQLFSQAEGMGTGIDWDNVDDMYTQQAMGKFTLDWCMYMMLIDAGIYFILAWYISHVFPGKYGIAEPWYFPVSPTYWGCRSHPTGDGQQHGETNRTMDPGNTAIDEEEPVDLPIGMSLHHLSKSFPSRANAVDNLTTNMYAGQITALLGHNGAGKTTAINMLTGLFPPTSGTAYVNGREILRDSTAIREDLGICPQHNILFDYMTVQEHLQFYSSLKGNLSSSQKKRDISRMLDLTGLRPSLNVKACHLSGGQCRRLSVALAFIGGSKVVILDEPTSGVDPAARRLIWDLIVQHRESHTILLCTHHLDEADILGDRVIIMHQGKLLCKGSPLYLKRLFGSGYRLTIAKDGMFSTGPPGTITSVDIDKFIRQRIHGARLVEEVGSEMTFTLPTHRGQAANFQVFFKQLHASRNSLHVASYGVSDTTLEEVFLKVTLQADRGQPLDAQVLRNWALNGEAEKGADRDSGVETGSSGESSGLADDNGRPLKGSHKVEGTHLKLRQFWALLVKRFHHNRRDYRSYLSQIILPCIFISLAMGFATIKPRSDHQPSLLLTPDLYESSFFRLSYPSPDNTAFASTLWHDPGMGTACLEDSDMRSKCDHDFSRWHDTNNTAYVDPPECWCEDGRQECPARATGPTLPHMYMKTEHKLFDLTTSQFDTADYLLRTQKDFIQNRYGGWSFHRDDEDANDTASKVKVWYNNKGWHSLPSYYNALSNMVLRAGVDSNGLASEQYGISVYNHPLSLSKEQLNARTLLQHIAEAGIALTILLAFCFIPAGYTIYLISERIHKEKHMQFVCGVGVLTYWGAALLWDMLNYLLTVGLAVAIAAAFDLSIYTARLNLPAFVATLAMFGWSTIPLMYLLVRGFKEVSAGYMIMFLLNLLIGITTSACTFLLQMFLEREGVRHTYDIVSKVLLVFPQFCLGDALLLLSRNQLTAEVYERFDIDNYRNPFTFDLIGWHLVAMAIEGTVFLVLMLALEWKPWNRSSAGAPKGPSDHKEDEEVSLERQRVVTGEARDDVLVLHSLKKNYRRGFKKVRAVDNISVGVPKGECFGLLGVNGAGKTTTFDMVTGDLLPTKGVALLLGKVISGEQGNINQEIGYCPQFDALDTKLTGEELIYCYARLKGIPGDDIPRVCETVVSRLGLQQYIKKTVRGYSGGTKRKLSAALALLGDPQLVLLDEPTTGMDPQTRRLVWNNILRVLRDNRSVVLTSHSMSECDALCTRMAIMVNGHFVCLGTGQHLKHKFGNGYTVTLRVGGSPPDLDTVAGFMRATFRGTFLKDYHRNMLEFEIPYNTAPLSEIFGCLEKEKVTYNIDDYSVYQTTLDQVFLNFARNQTDGSVEDKDDEDSASRVDPSREVYVYSNLAYDTGVLPRPQYQANVQQVSETDPKSGRPNTQLGIGFVPTFMKGQQQPARKQMSGSARKNRPAGEGRSSGGVTSPPGVTTRKPARPASPQMDEEISTFL